MKPTVTFAAAARFWLKLGFISFGGPAGQIAIMHRELVERRRWIGEERFLHALNCCMLLPGPEAQQLATYIGWLMHRTPGALVAGGFFVLPSVFLLLGLSYVYAAYGHTAPVAGLLGGFKPVVVAIVVEAVLRIGRRALERPAHYAIAALSFLSLYVFGAPFPLVILAAGLVGLAGVRLWPSAFLAPPWQRAQRVASHAAGGFVLDDEESPSVHARPSLRGLMMTSAVFGVLWLLPLTILSVCAGWEGLHARLYRFFSGAALVTFGGAYAVLSYVTQVAVGRYGWLTQSQAVDGLALAETTPGPLIMVLQFIGFLAGWGNPGQLSPTASAILAAGVTTYATFLPSFFFILAGAPYIELLREKRELSAALSGITAAVVGVVLNLALVFATAVIWPNGSMHTPDVFALALVGLAFVALERWKIQVQWVVLGGGALGLLRALLI